MGGGRRAQLPEGSAELTEQSVWTWGARLEPVPNPRGVSTLAIVAVDRRGVPCAARPLRTEAPPVPPPWVPPPRPPSPQMVLPAPLQAPTVAEIRRWRELRGLSQADLAHLVGNDRRSVAEMEHGDGPAVELRRAVGRLLARTMALPVGELPPPEAPLRAARPRQVAG